MLSWLTDEFVGDFWASERDLNDVETAGENVIDDLPSGFIGN